MGRSTRMLVPLFLLFGLASGFHCPHEGPLEGFKCGVWLQPASNLAVDLFVNLLKGFTEDDGTISVPDKGITAPDWAGGFEIAVKEMKAKGLDEAYRSGDSCVWNGFLDICHAGMAGNIGMPYLEATGIVNAPAVDATFRVTLGPVDPVGFTAYIDVNLLHGCAIDSNVTLPSSLTVEGVEIGGWTPPFGLDTWLGDRIAEILHDRIQKAVDDFVQNTIIDLLKSIGAGLWSNC